MNNDVSIMIKRCSMMYQQGLYVT